MLERHVLVILAHPDDETYGCGGTIAMYSRTGVPVTYVCATRGEMGRRMGNPPFANRETLGPLREQELRAACAALGVRDLRLLGIWDKTVEFVDPDQLAARVGAIIAEVQPSLVITFHPVYGGHPDHVAIGRATIRALAGLPPERRPRVHCLGNGDAMAKHGLVVHKVDITGIRDTKLAAVRAHRSQSEGMFEAAQQRDRNEWFERMQREERYTVYEF